MDRYSLQTSKEWSEERRDRLLRTLVRNTYTYHNNEILAVLRNEYTDWELAPSSSTTGDSSSGQRSSTSIRDNLDECLSDALVVAPLTQVLRYHSASGAPSRTYMFHLNYPGPHDQAPDGSPTKTASYHGDDVFYLLGLPIVSGGSSDQVDLAEQLIAYVAGFCYAGFAFSGFKL